MNKINTIGYDKELISGKGTSAVIGVLFFILATTLGAYVRIPVPGNPVPITLQTFFVILTGAVLGKKLGAISQFGYILLGVLGLPVFQGSAYGVPALLGPTGGYLIGFVFCAYFVGRMTDLASRGLIWAIAVFSAGSLIIYAFGASWLIFIYRVGPISAVSLGILPFVPGDTVKVLIAAMAYSRISQRSKHIFSV